MAWTLRPGQEVVVPWGFDDVQGTVVRVYGPASRLHVLVRLTLGLGDNTSDDATEVVSFPISSLRLPESAQPA